MFMNESIDTDTSETLTTITAHPQRGLSLRIKFIGTLTIVVFAIALIAIVLVQSTLTTVVQKEVKERGASIARNVAVNSADLIMIENELGLLQLLTRTKEVEQDIEYIFITDAHGEVVAHTFEDGFPRGLLDVNILAAKTTAQTELIEMNEENTLDFAASVLNGSLGAVHVGISESLIEESISETIWSIALLFMAICTLSIVLTFLFASSIIRPLQKLTEAARRIAEGNFNVKTGITTTDEIGELAEVFDVMTDNLKKTKVLIKNYTTMLEEKVKERTGELETKNSELQRQNKFMIDRELKMVELKGKIESLEKQLVEKG